MKKISDKYAIDGKFGVTSDGEFKIVNLVSGECIPDDEPLFLLRARDHLAVQLLNSYLDLAEKDHTTESHRARILNVLRRFQMFVYQHPERMKQPGITGHIDLKNDAP